MSTKTMTGWLLLAGPILTFLTVGILYEALIGPGETNLEAVQEAMANAQMARLLGMIGLIAFVSVFIGMTLLSRSMIGDDKPGSAYASAAGIVFAALTAIGILAAGLGLGAMDAARDPSGGPIINIVSDAAIIGLVSNGIFAPLFVFWGVGNLLVGSALLSQKNLPTVIGWLFIGWALFMLIVSAIEAVAIPDTVGLVLWAGLNLTMVATGYLTLRKN